MRRRPAIPNFAGRLDACLEKGGMNMANLGVWFERPHPTIYTWLNEGRQPAASRGMMTEVHRRLRLLEKLIADGKDFPIPHHIVQPRRGDYVRLIFRKHDEFSKFS